jgi:hypothetical protein
MMSAASRAREIKTGFSSEIIGQNIDERTGHFGGRSSARLVPSWAESRVVRQDRPFLGASQTVSRSRMLAPVARPVERFVQPITPFKDSTTIVYYHPVLATIE